MTPGSVRAEVEHVALELGQGLLDPEGGEPDPGVLVPALRHELGQAAQQLRAVPPCRHLWPRARHTHNLSEQHCTESDRESNIPDTCRRS